MNKTNKTCIEVSLFFVILFGLTFLWWTFAISQAWLNKIATPDEIKLALKSDPRAINNKTDGGWTGLMIAADLDDLERARVLLRYDANPNLISEDSYRQTALHMLCQKAYMTENTVKLIRLLLEHGASVDIQDIYGKTPLHWIGWIGDPHFRTQVLDLLMEHGANLNAVDNEGNTPLNTMIEVLWSRDQSWLKEALFDKYGNKIDPTIKNKRDPAQSSLDIARSRRLIPLIQVMCRTGKWHCTADERAGNI